ncbi:MAG: TRAM domain-containing protein, partial [Candidatus Izimaplasma sp.]|nr:TRAM domain-containing protein [Candidatus Izimaplasma bacterium]
RLDLVKQCRFEGAFTFVYSKRDGTASAKYEDNVSMKEKKARLQELNDFINEGYLTGTKRFEGEIIKVLVEGTSKNDDSVLAGYTENNKLVNFKGNKALIGHIVDVKITTAKTWFMIGEAIDKT